MFIWRCPRCEQTFKKDTKQGLGLARHKSRAEALERRLSGKDESPTGSEIMNDDNRHEVTPENAPTFRKWLAERGGLLVWQSINLSNPGQSWTTPALTEDGKPYPKPTWEAGDKPVRHITDAKDVVVIVPREVKRFRVGVRMGSQGLSLKVTDAGSRRIRKEVEKAGEGGFYEFDYSTQEAVIFAVTERAPL